jgi:glycerophosphoryl diester phosphodiesterase
MSTVLAHRGNLAGPTLRGENSRAAIGAALNRGFGIETDIRRAPDGRFYIAHDRQPTADECLADDIFELVRAYPDRSVALNIKEAGYERELLDYLREQRVLRQVYLFDMELIEQVPGVMAEQFRALDRDIRIAARVSDRGESIERALSIRPASIVWLDEFDRAWATERDVRRLKQAGRIVHAVSPDLHGHSLDRSRARWAQFNAWGVDGICTDYPVELREYLNGVMQGVRA